MEVTRAESLNQKLKNVFLKDPIPFASRREMNWDTIKKAVVAVVVLVVLGLLFLPASKPAPANFHERAEAGATQPAVSNASQSTMSQFDQSRASVGHTPRSLDDLYARPNGSGASGGGQDRKSSMIVNRGGLDSKTQVPPGSRIRVKILESVIVAGSAVPIIGVVAADYIHEDGLAIPQSAKVFGEVSFDDSSGRAQFSFRSIQMPDGRDRAFSALSIGLDGQSGVEGKLHSNGLQNVIGHTLTRFVAAYAAGSMERGALGGNPGGNENGLKNAVADTAKDRADAWAEDLKKEKKWIELQAGTEFIAVLREPFTFRDPGGSIR